MIVDNLLSDEIRFINIIALIGYCEWARLEE